VLDCLELVHSRISRTKIFGVLSPHYMKGFIFVEATAMHHVQKLIGRVGVGVTPLRIAARFWMERAPLEDVLSLILEPSCDFW